MDGCQYKTQTTGLLLALLEGRETAEVGFGDDDDSDVMFVGV